MAALNKSNSNSSSHEGSPCDATSCISSGDASSSIKEIEVDQEALTPDHNICYYGYYYPGFNGSSGEWDEHYYLLGSDGSEIQHPAAQTDFGSVFYYMPGFHHGYSPYSPGAVVGVDGQYFTQQPYCSSLISPQPLVSPGLSVSYGSGMVPLYQWEFPPSFHGTQGNVLKESPISSRSHKIASTRNLLPRKSTAEEKKGPFTVSDVKSQNQMTTTASKSHMHTCKVPQYTSPVKSRILYQNPSIVKEAGSGWIGDEKLKPTSKVHGVGKFSLLNEQNKGPRTDENKIVFTSTTDQGQSLASEGEDEVTTLVKKEEYNLPDCATKYEHALFFIIKSYSEDDIHKSIKYNVWSSTPSGNKRLDNAFQLAQQRMAETGTKCPVFLFFSVNASGQFCGLAEMIGRVDFNMNMNFWQQDKWTGNFPVKWHILKDVPNTKFRHIILENNENKPVTNSRDTQEVKLPQGTDVLNIFKNYSSNTSILDDFGFYENREKAMQAKKIKSSTFKLGYIVPRADEVSEDKKQIDLKSTAAIPESLEVAVTKTDKLLDALSLNG